MSTGKKVLEVRYRNRSGEEGLLYAEEKQISGESVTLRKCRTAHGIQCGITGKIEFYAQSVPKRVIQRQWVTSMLEIEPPSWWDNSREEVLRNLVWLNAEPELRTNSKRKTDAALVKLIAERRRGWEEATAVTNDVEDTFFRDLTKSGGDANIQVLEQRLQRVWPLLTASDLEALKQTGLPGLGTNDPRNQQLREWINHRAKRANREHPAQKASGLSVVAEVANG